MSFLSGIGDVLSNAIQSTLNATPAGQLMQLAESLFGSILGESGGTGNQAFDNILNSGWLDSVVSAVQNNRG